MQGLLGTPMQVYQVKSPPDNNEKPFKYIVMNITASMVDPWSIMQGYSDFHIWTFGPARTLSYQIRDQLLALFERLYYPSIENVSSVRYRYQSEHWLMEVNKRVHHHIVRFSVRWVEDKTITAVLTREGA